MASIVGDIGPSIDSFRRHLRASNAAPNTISTYLEGATQFATFLAAQGMSTNVPDIRREHVEAFVVDIVNRFKPATANNRYPVPARLLQVPPRGGRDQPIPDGGCSRPWSRSSRPGCYPRLR